MKNALALLAAALVPCLPADSQTAIHTWPGAEGGNQASFDVGAVGDINQDGYPDVPRGLHRNDRRALGLGLSLAGSFSPGQTVHAQLWHPDPSASHGVGLSDALQFDLLP